MTSGIRLAFSTAKVSRSRMMMYNTIPKPNNVNQVDAKLRRCFTSVARESSTNRSNDVNIVPPRMSNLNLERSYPFLGLGATCLLNSRLYSSSSRGSRGENVVSSGASVSDVGASTNGADGNDLMHKVKEFWESGVRFVSQTVEKVKVALGEVSLHVEQIRETHPYLSDVIVPVSGILAGTIAAWAILPTIFKRFHKYSEQGPGSLLLAGLFGPVPYEKSLWGALEVPVKYLITFMAFSQIGAMVAPTISALQSLGPVWRAAALLSFVWFLHRWKTNVVTCASVVKSGADRDKLLALDNFSSVGLFVLSGMVLAEASGVAVQTVWIAGGIGGIATAYAAKDIHSNVLSGSILASQTFSVGDIKVKGLPTHNVFAKLSKKWATGSVILAPTNKLDSVTSQLDNGVRLMLDMYDFESDIWLCHSFGGKCYNYTAFQPAVNVLKEIQIFLENNPSEIMTIIIEDYVTSPNGLTNVFNAAGLEKNWFPVAKMKSDGRDWPTTDPMVQNLRLVVFTSKSSKEATEGIAYEWKYLVENQYGTNGMKSGTCPNRAESAAMNMTPRSLVLTNYFPDTPDITQACKDNSAPLISMVNTCHDLSRKCWPNFISVDFYKPKMTFEECIVTYQRLVILPPQLQQ